MRNVPDYVRVSKAEYRQLRKELEHQCHATGHDFAPVWDLMIGTIEKRHDQVLKGKRKTEITLRQGVEAMIQQLVKDRAKADASGAKAAVLRTLGKAGVH